jgi:hypothetical protein
MSRWSALREYTVVPYAASRTTRPALAPLNAGSARIRSSASVNAAALADRSGVAPARAVPRNAADQHHDRCERSYADGRLTKPRYPHPRDPVRDVAASLHKFATVWGRG